MQQTIIRNCFIISIMLINIIFIPGGDILQRNSFCKDKLTNIKKYRMVIKKQGLVPYCNSGLSLIPEMPFSPMRCMVEINNENRYNCIKNGFPGFTQAVFLLRVTGSRLTRR